MKGLFTLAKRIATNKYVWVAMVAYVIGTSVGTVKTEYQTIEKTVEVPIEKTVYAQDQSWKELKEVDDKIIKSCSGYVAASVDVFGATAAYFEDFNSEKLVKAATRGSEKFREETKRMEGHVQERQELLSRLEQGQ